MIAVYTALIGKDVKDKLQPVQEEEGVRYIAFTDRPDLCKDGKGWEVCPPHAFSGEYDLETTQSSRRLARKHKILSHLVVPEADFSVWLDGSLSPKASIAELFPYEHNPILQSFRHSERACVYQEAQTCIQMQKDKPHLIREQMDRYRELGFPYHYGLTETTCVIRKNTEKVSQFNELWWGQLSRGSLRDQLSFDFCTWRTQLPVNYLPGTVYKNRFFEWRSHWN